MVDEQSFGSRLSDLRRQKNISARRMSIDIGQNPGYINSIENGKAFPSMDSFFYICSYLGITPVEYFDTDEAYPLRIHRLLEFAKKLSSEDLDSFNHLAEALIKGK